MLTNILVIQTPTRNQVSCTGLQEELGNLHEQSSIQPSFLQPASTAKMMNEMWKIGAPSVLERGSSEAIPQPNSKQALVRIRAVSLNFRDLLILDHSPAYPSTAKNGLVPCSDGSGVVEEAGPESTWEKGDRVVLQSNTWNDGDTRNFVLDEVYGGSDRDGTLRRFMVVDDAQLLKIPKNWSFAEAATLFTGGVTAARAMFFGPIRAEAGVTVVTQGTGGVSCYAIQVTSQQDYTALMLFLLMLE